MSGNQDRKVNFAPTWFSPFNLLLPFPFVNYSQQKAIKSCFPQVKWIEFPESGVKRGNGERDIEAAEELLKRGSFRALE